MRSLLVALFAVPLAPLFAAEPTPKAIVEDAIKAHGGADALAKAAKGSQKMAGTMTVLGAELSFAGDVLYALPDKHKSSLTLSYPGVKRTATQVVNGDKTKTVMDGKVLTLSDAMKGELRQNAANQEISLLVALMDDKKYTLKTGPDGKVGDADTVAVVVSGKGITNVTLHFEKKSGRLVGMTREAVGDGDKPVKEETAFSEFKAFEGVLLPTKLIVTRAGKKFLTATVSDAKWLEKIDEKAFAVDE